MRTTVAARRNPPDSHLKTNGQHPREHIGPLLKAVHSRVGKYATDTLGETVKRNHESSDGGGRHFGEVRRDDRRSDANGSIDHDLWLSVLPPTPYVEQLTLPTTSCQNLLGPERSPRTRVSWTVDPMSAITASRRKDRLRPRARADQEAIMHPIIVPAVPRALMSQ
jgi:hypothetical protein